MKQEQRTHKSVNFFLLDQGTYPMWSFSNQKDAIAGLIHNLSPFGGKLLLTSDSLTVGETLRLSLNQTHSSKKLSINARTLWKKSNPVSKHEEVGCQFIKPSDKLTLALMELIRTTHLSNKKMYFRCELYKNAQLNA